MRHGRRGPWRVLPAILAVAGWLGAVPARGDPVPLDPPPEMLAPPSSHPSPAAVPRAGQGEARNFTLIGHHPLYARGMNAAPALFGRHLYIGSRTDGSEHHPHSGVLAVDVGNPAHPEVVGEIGPPHEGNPGGETSRELRVWPEAKLLIVMHTLCSPGLHHCAPPGGPFPSPIRFYDLGEPAAPRLVATYFPTRGAHEMFLWVDPDRPGRALLYLAVATAFTNLPNLIVTDISRAREGLFTERARWNANDLFTQQDRNERDIRLHSVSLSPDGRRAFVSYLGGGFIMLDTADLAEDRPAPEVRLLTPVTQAAIWPNGTVHSAVKLFGRPVVLTTDEIYGDLLDPQTKEESGCPWAWVHLIDIADPSRPRVIGEYRTEQNQAAWCESGPGRDPLNTTWTSYSPHNPTVVRDVALVTWHSNGLCAIDLSNPARPVEAGRFKPEPLPAVATEDPALSLGPDKVVFWSYPIIDRGSIYVVDIRNGLYVLRYHGPGAGEINRIRFLEGNSNLGDALELEGRRRP